MDDSVVLIVLARERRELRSYVKVEYNLWAVIHVDIAAREIHLTDVT